jgi:hypothetical protein
MKILHMTLKKKWFDMIASGEKKEEYRELKGYWMKRLLIEHGDGFKTFDIVRFKNGYSPNAPMMDVECKGTEVGNGKYEWGCTNKSFIIKLGKILSITNYTPSLTEKANT